MSETSGWQLSGDAPTAYTRFALKIMEPWTDDLILAAECRDGDHVLDVGDVPLDVEIGGGVARLEPVGSGC